MTPLTLGGSAADIPRTYPDLLDLLESRPQPALTWYGTPAAGAESERVELSGRVLQNWAIKLIGLLSQESELEPGDTVLVDAQAHWKVAAVVLAAGALEWRVALTASSSAALDSSAPGSPAPGSAASGNASDDDARRTAAAAASAALIITDRPGDWTGSGVLAESLGEAELAALSPGLLDASFEEATGEKLPAWVLDISADVRQHPDQLPAPLPPVKLATADLDTTGPTGAQGGAGVSSARGGLVLAGAAPEVAWQDWTLARWDGAEAPRGPGGVVVIAAMLDAWARNQPVVLFQGDPAAHPEAWEQLLRNEGVH